LRTHWRHVGSRGRHTVRLIGLTFNA
jgi:hypothetical protein